MDKVLPKRTKAQKTGKKSQDLFSSVFSEFCNVVPIPQSDDLGIDFECEVLESEFPTGKRFGIQCKGSEELSNDKDYFSVQIEKKTLNYWLIQKFPVFLVIVDNKNQHFFWTDPKEQIENLSKLPEKKSIRVSKKDFFDSTLKGLPQDMQTIINDYSKKYVEYESMIDELKKLKEINVILSENTNSALGVSKGYFKDIHTFLDKLNYLLDYKFAKVKEVFYENCWKIGLAYQEFDDKNLTCSLYPIHREKNDVQIKEIDDSLREKLKQFGLRGHFQENPILTNAKGYAMEIIQSKLTEILEHKFLSHKENFFLMNEFLIAFTDKFYIQMGLEVKDVYEIKELKDGFNKYMPIWIDEVLKEPHITIGRMRYTAPSFLLSQLLDEKRSEIAQRVKNRLEKGDYNKRDLVLGDNKFYMRMFVHFINNLEEKGITSVKRIYTKKEYSRLGERGGLVWNTLTLDNLEKNLTIFFRELPKVFDQVIKENFPALVDELHFFNKYNRLVVVLKGKDWYETSESPTLQLYGITDPKLQKNSVEVYREGEKQITVKYHNGINVQINNETFKARMSSSQILDFMYDDLPMLNHVYALLAEEFKEYLEKSE